MMQPKLMVEPSAFLKTGIQVEIVNGVNLFKFTPELQARSDELLMRSKEKLLNEDENAEWASISELAQIFSYANSMLMAGCYENPQP
jgi:hypothetical protein